MPKLPRGVKPRKLIRFLKKRGCRVVREGAKHTVMACPESDPFTVPRGGTLKVGTLNAILKQAGISRQDVVENL